MNKNIEKLESYFHQFKYRIKIFEILSKNFDIKNVLYPGSYVDITPSIIFYDVTYIDNNKIANSIFKNNISTVYEIIEKEKKYTSKLNIEFIYSDYWNEMDLNKSFDLLISLYAGFVSQACKKYLKKDGILFVNDSHGDATSAYFDNTFELIGVIDNNKIFFNSLEQYFISKKEIDLVKVKNTMKPPKYIKNADFYIFKKVR
ncbi:hypothetical protein [Marinitoga sp. 38H-ov]|uniref:hypothetical protein n=1 Tax=Marinitoga sp. 38H-ov TaxID=1755814 RepID=UPI0013EB29AA|nr:hypothetical protein [Marinitoga sp. 38H-ov]KAF2956847.1 hypothetical protein AS160_03600 [Marinitoga sp. 38H-ov]